MQRQYRLKGERNFRIVFRRGTSVSSKYLTLMVLKSKYPTCTKFGLSVGKKVGNAVVRNLVKRRLRAIVTELLPDIKKGYSYVLVARSGIQDAPFQSLRRDVCDLFGRVK